MIIPTTTPLPTPTPTLTPIPGQWAVEYILFSPKAPTQLHALQKNISSGAYRLMLSVNYGQNWYEALNTWPVGAACFNNLNLDYHRPDNYYSAPARGFITGATGSGSSYSASPPAWSLTCRKPGHPVGHRAGWPHPDTGADQRGRPNLESRQPLSGTHQRPGLPAI